MHFLFQSLSTVSMQFDIHIKTKDAAAAYARAADASISNSVRRLCRFQSRI